MDISEAGSVNYRIVDGVVTSFSREHRRPVLTRAEWQTYLKDWVPVVETGGVGLGAFDGHRLVGVAVLRLDLESGIAQLVALYIDREHRRKGVAAALTDAVED